MVPSLFRQSSNSDANPERPQAGLVVAPFDEPRQFRRIPQPRHLVELIGDRGLASRGRAQEGAHVGNRAADVVPKAPVHEQQRAGLVPPALQDFDCLTGVAGT
jgi:hypothetical protein